MKVPYHRQEFPWSCFAACVKMVLEFIGIKKVEKDLRPLLRVTPYVGGSWYYAELGLESLGLHFYWSYGFSLEELKELIKGETPIVVSLRFESGKEYHLNHTVVVTDVTDDFIIVHDPERDENMRIGVKHFSELWSNRRNLAGYIKKV